MSNKDFENSTDMLRGQTPNNPVDLFVIGGGINGVGIARDAAGRGLSVYLCEKGDLAEGTSSRSGKYIHGGLRYLEYFEFRLVREALLEREVILNIAPQLTRPIQLILPHSPEQRPFWLIRLGLFLYDNLGKRKKVPRSSTLNLLNCTEGKPVKNNYKKAFSYWDVWVDDARLVVLNAIDAARKGAQIATRTKCQSARREEKLWRIQLKNESTGQQTEIYSKTIFNAAGPWVKNVITEVAGLKSRLNVRLVKGSHIILSKWWEGNHGYVLQTDDKRLIFVNPYFDDMALVGTTDILFEGNAEDVSIESDEIDYLLKNLHMYFNKKFNPANIIASYSGVRPLFDDDKSKDVSAVTRDYQFEQNGLIEFDSNQPPILSAFGGKLTTYRKLSEHALEKFANSFPRMTGKWTANSPLPGGDIPENCIETWIHSLQHEFSYLPKSLLTHFGHCYGTETYKLLDGVTKISDLGQKFGRIFFEKEAEWLIQNEWALNSDDILFRRTKHGLFLKQQEVENFSHWLENK